MNNHTWSHLLFLTCLASVIGCHPPRYKLAPVSGTVTLAGEPLAGGVVSFQPIATAGSDVGPGSTGRLDDEGRFVLLGPDGAHGAVVGEHWVRIYSHSPESPAVDDVDASETTQERVPVHYNYRTTLRFHVPPSGTQSADFQL